MAALLVAVAIQASLDSEARKYSCGAPQSQAEMTACAGIDFARADAQLNAVWRKAVAQAQAADREWKEIQGGDKRPGSEAVLREAQRAWLNFRDAHCTLEAYDARGGSMEPMLYNGCRARITRERLVQLRPPPPER